MKRRRLEGGAAAAAAGAAGGSDEDDEEDEDDDAGGCCRNKLACMVSCHSAWRLNHARNPGPDQWAREVAGTQHTLLYSSPMAALHRPCLRINGLWQSAQCFKQAGVCVHGCKKNPP